MIDFYFVQSGWITASGRKVFYVIRLHRRLDHAEWELDIALRDGKRR